MDIQIQKATFNNLNQLLFIEESLEHRILSNDVIISTLNNNNYYYYVAIERENVIGYIAVEFMIDHFDLLAIAVLDKYRMQGVATLLLKKIISLCSKLNITDVFLEVRYNNIPALKFYEKNGFKKINIRKNYYIDTNEHAYIYKKTV